ncbi:hypothetical protein [Sulfuricella sp.]|uniref:hypothetical protein n=1 Tax=Sulfuricella sp. TaxID=2099377 RepID=UPI002C37A4F0|nr:hypothetical protein [Sulfuricella sp.]HUX65108.1 hypothetical protein [Sulfuricella sp.]
MSKKLVLPPEFEHIRKAALRAIGEIRPTGPETLADPKFLFTAQRTKASNELPAYYLVYFLLVDLLGFKNLGQFEKISWSVPIDFNGKAYLIEHRKMGLGIFAHDASAEEDVARQIVIRIQKGVKAAQPFFEWLAGQAVQNSAVNVLNKSEPLFDRFTYHLETYRIKAREAVDRKDERHVETRNFDGGSSTSVHMPARKLRTESRWLALAAIEAFYSWTEHVFIHIAILNGKVKTGNEVTELAEADWQAKFKRALDVTEPTTKNLFDKLVVIRKQLRNFVAHGAFGKQGEAFKFHSGAGAVPVLLPHLAGSRKFVLGSELSFEDDQALAVIEEFIAHLWSGPRQAAEFYIQKSGLPLILTMVADGTYAQAMTSIEDMTDFVDHLTGRFDQAANMDW